LQKVLITIACPTQLYFNGLTKLFSNLYLIKLKKKKSFFPCNSKADGQRRITFLTLTGHSVINSVEIKRFILRHTRQKIVVLS